MSQVRNVRLACKEDNNKLPLLATYTHRKERVFSRGNNSFLVRGSFLTNLCQVFLAGIIMAEDNHKHNCHTKEALFL
jgi:hypothetical protein